MARKSSLTLLRVLLAGVVAFGAVCIWFGAPWLAYAAIVPVAVAVYRKFIPVQHRRLVGQFRLLLVVMWMHVWVAALLAPLCWVLGSGWDWLWLAGTLPAFLFAWRDEQAPFPAWLVLALRVLWDTPLTLAAVAWAAGGWRLHSLMTPMTQQVFLGSIPFSWDVEHLRHRGVTHVVNMCAEYEGPIAAYAKAGVEQLYVPVPDGDVPRTPQVQQALRWMADALATPTNRVLVHCKAGMGRSATIVLAHFIANGWAAKKAVQHMKTLRPEVAGGVLHYPCISDIVTEVDGEW